MDPAEKYKDIIKDTDSFLIKEVAIIDEYKGDQIADDKRSITLNIEYNAKDRTLTDEEIQKIHKIVLQNVEKSGAELRM